jgi:hypothetical protein
MFSREPWRRISRASSTIMARFPAKGLSGEKRGDQYYARQN